jgi:hypothetical protein
MFFRDGIYYAMMGVVLLFLQAGEHLIRLHDDPSPRAIRAAAGWRPRLRVR